VSGLTGGWLAWIVLTVSIMAILTLIISLALRKFLNGAKLVAVTVVLMTCVTLLMLASGRAESDFTYGVVVPYLICSAAIASAWLLSLKVRANHG